MLQKFPQAAAAVIDARQIAIVAELLRVRTIARVQLTKTLWAGVSVL